MGSWRPPAAGGRGAARAPPVTVTGVAPWAGGPAKPSQPPVTVTGVAPWAAAGAGAKPSQPPVTVTGVAPWATAPQVPPRARAGGGGNKPGGGGFRTDAPWATGAGMPPSGAAAQSTRKRPLGVSAPPLGEALEEAEEEDDEEGGRGEGGRERARGGRGRRARARAAFMERYRPADEAEKRDAQARWSAAQLAPTPTLLPTLKFHDLVFGHELGEGAFSTVRYARQIIRDDGGGGSPAAGRGEWPRVRGQGHLDRADARARLRARGRARTRDPAARRAPGRRAHGLGVPLARRRVPRARVRRARRPAHARRRARLARRGLEPLRRRRGARRARERARRGLRVRGPQSRAVVITESGHVKLTDFGACRPVTAEAAAQLRGSRDAAHAARRRLARARRREPPRPPARAARPRRRRRPRRPPRGDGLVAADDDDGAGDERVEGTTLYLPPEVVRDGERPALAADAWSLGCVLYYRLRGRPPVFAESRDGPPIAAIVSFDASAPSAAAAAAAARSADDDERFPPGFPPAARALVARLMEREPRARARRRGGAPHAFFEGVARAHELRARRARALRAAAPRPRGRRALGAAPVLDDLGVARACRRSARRPRTRSSASSRRRARGAGVDFWSPGERGPLAMGTIPGGPWRARGFDPRRRRDPRRTRGVPSSPGGWAASVGLGHGCRLHLHRPVARSGVQVGEGGAARGSSRDLQLLRPRLLVGLGGVLAELSSDLFDHFRPA